MTSDKVYFRVRAVVRVLVALLLPHRVEGLENLPAEGAFILCSNHLSDLDPFLLVAKLTRHVYFMAKRELFGVPVVRGVIRAMGAFPVDRGSTDLAAVRKALDLIKNGQGLGIFPQGHRYKKDDCREIQTGAALIALRTRVPVIHVHISAPLRFFRRGVIRLGAPVDLSDFDGKASAASLGEASRRIAAAIWTD